jgi:hypothetical protein
MRACEEGLAVLGSGVFGLFEVHAFHVIVLS